MSKQESLFSVDPVRYQSLFPRVEKMGEQGGVSDYLWDIPYTITELSYLTHSHYRYYGKFPPAIPAQLISQCGPFGKDDFVFDNFCGSGTTLVEAKLAGIRSVGIDISWISALASTVKVRHVDLAILERATAAFVNEFPHLVVAESLDSPFAVKWFDPDVAVDLAKAQQWLLSQHRGPVRDFLLVGYLAIIRRVSKAHDAEVRPHINPAKRPRDVQGALRKKLKEMIENQAAFQGCTDPAVEGECLVWDNRTLPLRLAKKRCALVVSHPPYLNSFNYRPVFSLEFHWGAPFETDYVAESKTGLIRDELLAHPASADIIQRYYEHLRACYTATYNAQPKGGYLAVVIGDCTRNGELVPVIEDTCALVTDIGYQLSERNFRTTHYGLGKYAYKHRADYHGTHEAKRDAILVFRKSRD